MLRGPKRKTMPDELAKQLFSLLPDEVTAHAAMLDEKVPADIRMAILVSNVIQQMTGGMQFLIAREADARGTDHDQWEAHADVIGAELMAEVLETTALVMRKTLGDSDKLTVELLQEVLRERVGTS